MILADTSVWVRSFLQRPGFAAELRRQLLEGRIAGHELVYGELLMGDTGRRGAFLHDYECLPWAKMAPHVEAVTLARQHKLTGKGLGWIDLHLLAAAVKGSHRLWSADERLAAAAADMGIGWLP